MLISTGYLSKYVSKSLESNEWIGEVVDNNDPIRGRRVKVRVRGWLEGEPSSLPWAHLKCSIGLGGGNYSGFAVPNVGSKVLVSFEHGIYCPIITGVYGNEETSVEEFLQNYPASYGFKDEQGTIIIVDRAAGTLKLHHGPSGNEFLWDKSGNETKLVKGNSKTVVIGTYSVESGGEAKMKGSTTTLESSGASTIKCSGLNIV